MESVGGYAYFVSEGTLSADPKIRGQRIFLVGKLSFKRIA